MWTFVVIIGAIAAHCGAQEVVHRRQHPDEVLHEVTEPSPAALTRKALEGLTTSEVIRGVYPTVSEVPERSTGERRIESLPQPEALRQTRPPAPKPDTPIVKEEFPELFESLRTVDISRRPPVIQEVKVPLQRVPEPVRVATGAAPASVAKSIQIIEPIPQPAVPVVINTQNQHAAVPNQATRQIVPLPHRGISVPSELNAVDATAVSDRPESNGSTGRLVQIEVAPQTSRPNNQISPQTDASIAAAQPALPPTANLHVIPISQNPTIRTAALPAVTPHTGQTQRQIVDFNVLPSSSPSINNRPSISAADVDSLRAIFGNRPRTPPAGSSSSVLSPIEPSTNANPAQSVGSTSRQSVSTGYAADSNNKDFYSVYQFGYEVHTPEGSHSHEEAKTPTGLVFGSYSLALADGRRRHVSYEADNEGFHPEVHTNELGTLTSEPGDARFFSTQSLEEEPATSQSVFPFQLPPRGYIATKPAESTQTSRRAARRARKSKATAASASASRRSSSKAV